MKPHIFKKQRRAASVWNVWQADLGIYHALGSCPKEAYARLMRYIALVRSGKTPVAGGMWSK